MQRSSRRRFEGLHCLAAIRPANFQFARDNRCGIRCDLTSTDFANWEAQVAVARAAKREDHAFRLQSWQRRAATATSLLARSEALPVSRDIYTRALEAAPHDWILARNAGAMFVARDAPAEALSLLQRAAAWIDDDLDTLVPLGWAHHALGQTSEAEDVFTKVREREPTFPGFPAQP